MKDPATALFEDFIVESSSLIGVAGINKFFRLEKQIKQYWRDYLLAMLKNPEMFEERPSSTKGLDSLRSMRNNLPDLSQVNDIVENKTATTSGCAYPSPVKQAVLQASIETSSKRSNRFTNVTSGLLSSTRMGHLGSKSKPELKNKSRTSAMPGTQEIQARAQKGSFGDALIKEMSLSPSPYDRNMDRRSTLLLPKKLPTAESK